MKNQISIEYLGTFGWIMLVVMVTVLALAQFGVLDLSSEFPENCYLGEQIICKKHYLDENGNLVLTLESRLNKNVQITDFDLEGYHIDVTECSSLLLPVRDEVNIICTVRDYPGGSAHIFADSRQNFDVALTLLPEGSLESYVVEGSLVSDVVNQDISSAFDCASLVSGTWDLCDPGMDWQCEGNPIDEYLGTDVCCEGTCNPDPCTGPPIEGVCCTASRCGEIIESPVNAVGECAESGKLCCNSCVGGGGHDDSDPNEDLG